MKILETLGKGIKPSTDKWLVSNDPLERQLKSSRALHHRQKALKKLFQ